jgi:ubiquinone/menaquinone biosynthesis C-methylase UbiE
MPDIRDPSYPEREQYKDATHLNARIQLHQCFSTHSYGWFKWVFDQFMLFTDASILEIGCGPGTFWGDNSNRIPDDWHITLSDFSPGMVREAKNNLRLHRGYFTFESSNAMAIPFPNATFDAVVANHMLYHVPDRQMALKEINRVLKPNGQFFAATNGKNHLRELDEIIDACSLPTGAHLSTTFSSAGFTLDNGVQQLTPWFTQLVIRHYADALIVTEAKPLVNYILSMIPHTDIIPDDSYETRLITIVNDKIQQYGAINIQKSTGMITGVKRIYVE